MNGHSDAFVWLSASTQFTQQNPVVLLLELFCRRYALLCLADYLETKIGPGKPGPR